LKGAKEYSADLLVLIFSHFSSFFDCASGVIDVDGLIKSLSNYDIVISGSELTSLLSLRISLKKAPPSWKVHASRPLQHGPLFITSLKENGDRSTTGGLAKQFRHAIITPGRYHRITSIRRLVIGGLRILVAGHIDALDPETLVPCHVQVRPDWGRRDNARMLMIWQQSKISGVEKVVTGIYKTREIAESEIATAPPLMTFSRREVRWETLKGFGKDLRYRSESILYLQEVLAFAVEKCVNSSGSMENKKVWKLKGRMGGDTEIGVETDREFPITRDLLYRAAEAMISFKLKGL
jgi:hypothetical protein